MIRLLHPAFRKKPPYFGRTDSRLSFAVLRSLDNPYAASLAIRYILLEAILAVMPETVVVADQQRVHMQPVCQYGSDELFLPSGGIVRA